MTDWYQWIIYIAVILLLISAIITAASLIRFSSILIKLVIMEVFANLLMASIALCALLYQQPIFIDICLPLALVMFLGVVAYYQFLLSKEDADAKRYQ